MVKDTAIGNDRAIELLDLAERSRVLDVGCGQGRTLATLLAAGHDVIGVDPSTTMVSQASRRNRQAIAAGRAQVVHSNGRTIPLPDGSVDAALTTHTVYFMPDLATTVTEVLRVLRPGGRFIIVCHVGDDPLPPWADPAVYRPPAVGDLITMLNTAGFAHATVVARDTASWPTLWFEAARATA
ncbi:MAG: class I SAM-dependent methyltransferase [Actinomycetota bacterium]